MRKDKIKIIRMLKMVAIFIASLICALSVYVSFMCVFGAAGFALRGNVEYSLQRIPMLLVASAVIAAYLVIERKIICINIAQENAFAVRLGYWAAVLVFVVGFVYRAMFMLPNQGILH